MNQDLFESIAKLGNINGINEEQINTADYLYRVVYNCVIELIKLENGEGVMSEKDIKSLYKIIYKAVPKSTIEKYGSAHKKGLARQLKNLLNKLPSDEVQESINEASLSVADVISRLEGQKEDIDKLIYGLFRHCLKTNPEDKTNMYNDKYKRRFTDKAEYDNESNKKENRIKLSRTAAPSSRSSFTQEYCNGGQDLTLYKMAISNKNK